MLSWVVDWTIIATEVVLSKLGASGIISGRLGILYDGSSSAENGRLWYHV